MSCRALQDSMPTFADSADAGTAHKEELDQFLYAITHDFKAHLTALREVPDWIAEDLDRVTGYVPSEVQGELAMLRNSADTLIVMLEGLTEIARVGRQADARVQTCVAALTCEQWSKIDGNDRFILDTSAAKDLIEGPEDDLKRLFLAVLENAVHHAQPGAGRVAVSSARQGNRVLVRIEDNGPGIEPRFREKVFQPLYMLARRDETGRAGLGLSLARKVTQSLGGHISIAHSSGDAGCAVTFDLPRAFSTELSTK